MIILASDDEGVVLQYIDKRDQTIDISSSCVSFINYFSIICANVYIL